MSDETRFQEMKRYVRLSEADAALLAAFRLRAAPAFPRIAHEFYDRIREHEEAHAVFTGEDQIERLQRSLVAWLGRVCGGVYDETYHAETAKIGRIHVRIGLPQRYMFTSMALIRVALLRICDEMPGPDASPTREALMRVLDLDLATMLETYHEAITARLEHVDRLQVKELGRALARAEHRYVNAVELARVLIIGLDDGCRIRLFNREAEAVTGFARDEVMGADFLETLVPEEERERTAGALARMLRGERASDTLHGSLRTRAGKERDVVWSLAFAASNTDDEVVLFSMATDVTDAKALAERTRQAEKLAAIGTLAAGLAHEIRNPLNGAQLHVSFLERAIRRKDGDPEMLDAASIVADEIKRLAHLVTEFLDFARPKPIEPKPVTLGRMCERARSMVSAKAEAAGVDLDLDLPSSDVEFLADPAKLEQVLLNLLANAIEAFDPGRGGKVVIRGRRTPRHVSIEIEDDGPGLPSPDAPIFDAFFSTKEGGTGLGLAITHRIVTDHGGSVQVESKPGRTLFRVMLPLARSEGSVHEQS